MRKVLIPLLLCIILFNTASKIYAQSGEGLVADSIEYQALVELYNSTDGVNWTNNTNWLNDSSIDSIATWYGVTVTDGDVTRLNLNFLNLTGHLPSSLGNLKALTYLDLGNNQLIGSIPSELGQLSNLQQLLFNINQLSGPIPSELGQLTNLTYLRLNSNNLTAEIPSELGQLNNLIELSLYQNQLDSLIPPELGQLQNLTNLYLQSCQLTGPIPSELGQLSNLRNLSLNNNQLTSTIPAELGQLSNLNYLQLHSNQLSGTIPPELGQLNSLTSLWLSNNQLGGPIPPELGQIITLNWLDLSSNELTDTIPSQLGQITNLQRCILNNNQLAGIIPSELGQLSNLTHLYLNTNNLDGLIPSELGQLNNLTRCDLQYNSFNSIPDFINKINLTLNAGHNNLDFEDLEPYFTGIDEHEFMSFTYSYQAKVGNEEVLYVTEGSNIEISVLVSGAQTYYQWQKKDGSDVWQDIAGATDSLLIIPNSALSDSGEYKCIMGNNWVTGLTLESNIITVIVTEKLLIGSWPFDDGTANDVSGNENHGTAMNGAALTTDRFGNENAAYSFDGIDDEINMGNQTIVNNNFTNGITLSAWFKLDKVPSVASENYNVISKGGTFGEAPNSPFALTFYHGSDGLYFDLWNNDTRSYLISSKTDWEVGKWYQVTATWDGTTNANTQKIYINGELDAQRTCTIEELWVVDSDLKIGNCINRPFDGNIDDVKIYNYDIAESEILDLYNAPNPKQLVGSWNFNDGTANDESANSNHGTVNGATLTTDRFGNENSAYSFDGVDDYIKVLNSESLNFGTGDFTVSTWIKWDEATSEHDFILAKGSAGAIGYGLGINTGGHYGAFIQAEGGVNQYYGNTLINADDWNLLTVVHDRDNKIKVYLNGSLANSGDYSEGNENSISTNYKLFIGSYGGDGRYFKGLIDDIQIYNYALTGVEITKLYNAPNPKQLVGSWTFNDGTANDQSDNNYHGTALNGATLSTDRFGNENAAYSFDGTDDYISLSGCENFSSEKGTIAFWMKAQGHSRGVFKFYSNQADEHHNHDYIRSYINSNGKLDLIVEDEDVAELHVQYDLNLIPNGYLNEWLHIAWAQDGNGVKLYVNGEEKPLEYITGNSGWWSGHLGITHAFIGNCWGFFDGDMDDFQIYNYALSGTDIVELYNSSDPGPISVPKLVAEVQSSGNDLSVTPEGGNGDYTYLWSTGETESSITTDGTGLYNVKVTDGLGNMQLASFDFGSAQNDFGHNFVRMQTILVEGIDELLIDNLNDSQENITFNYLDGLGRQKQVVNVKASPMKNDIVQHIEYDNLGRQAIEYLPYSVASELGAFREYALAEQSTFHYSNTGIANDAFPYAKKIFDNSPLNRVEQQGAPGGPWQPADAAIHHTFDPGHTIEYKYLISSSSDGVIEWDVDDSGNCTNNGTYGDGDLFKNQTFNEGGYDVIEFIDKEGKTILKKAFDGSNYLLTYYIYDDFGRLRYVLPPEATNQAGSSLTPTSLSELIYYYEYDKKGRMVKKKIPGADEILMVYDARSRLVLTQDGNMETEGKWSFTKYDVLNRPVMTGVIEITGSTYSDLVTAFEGHSVFGESVDLFETYGYTLNNSYPGIAAILETDLLSITYYDNYEYLNTFGYSYSLPDGFESVTVESNPINQVTGTIVWNLDQSEYYVTVNYYDEYNRLIQTTSENHLGGLDILNTQYDFVGKVTQTKISNDINILGHTQKSIWELNEYDHEGRLLRQYHQYGDISDDKILMAEYTYNERGELASKKMHSTDNGANFLQEVNYEYNIRGWLTQINDADLTDDTDLFGMELSYNTQPVSFDTNVENLYNGNISTITWNTNNGTKLKRGYGFEYDQVNRLKNAYYGDANGWQNGLYDVQGITYDLNGNINNVSRNAGEDGEIDNLQYVYNGNKLQAVGDAGMGTKSLGFNDGVDGNTTTEYLYDNNGNLIEDKNKNLFFDYNYLNLPTVANNGWTTHANMLSFEYDATGKKLSEMYIYENNYINFDMEGKYYMGNFIYNYNKTYISMSKYTHSYELAYILTPEGRITFDADENPHYEYFLKDHLGSVRASFADYNSDGNAELIQEDSYYPFGMLMPGLSAIYGTTNNNYLYNGKELYEEKGLNWYDYGARMYDATLGRWHTLDPMMEKYPDFSPYAYCFNNPIRFIDPNGMEGFDPIVNDPTLPSSQFYSTYDRFGNMYFNDGWGKFYDYNYHGFNYVNATAVSNYGIEGQEKYISVEYVEVTDRIPGLNPIDIKIPSTTRDATNVSLNYNNNMSDAKSFNFDRAITIAGDINSVMDAYFSTGFRYDYYKFNMTKAAGNLFTIYDIGKNIYEGNWPAAAMSFTLSRSSSLGLIVSVGGRVINSDYVQGGVNNYAYHEKLEIMRRSYLEEQKKFPNKKLLKRYDQQIRELDDLQWKTYQNVKRRK